MDRRPFSMALILTRSSRSHWKLANMPENSSASSNRAVPWWTKAPEARLHRLKRVVSSECSSRLPASQIVCAPQIEGSLLELKLPLAVFFNPGIAQVLIALDVSRANHVVCNYARIVGQLNDFEFIE